MFPAAGSEFLLTYSILAMTGTKSTPRLTCLAEILNFYGTANLDDAQACVKRRLLLQHHVYSYKKLHHPREISHHFHLPFQPFPIASRYNPDHTRTNISIIFAANTSAPEEEKKKKKKKIMTQALLTSLRHTTEGVNDPQEVQEEKKKSIMTQALSTNTRSPPSSLA
ncbi:hypothetical protein LZ32DRAFT_220607 [Colletotrichum eremochloae]|nr:hypothetical protein LZ32DRAFT_220607 [Colletotrichum eremochloae]